MTASEALERIQSLLLRTEERGASEAEANAAARLVCKLLRKFPELLSPTMQQRRPQPQHGWTSWRPTPPERPPEPVRTKDDSVWTSFKCEMLQDTAGLYRVRILSRNKVVWLPIEHVSIRGQFIWIPRWLCREKGLD